MGDQDIIALHTGLVLTVHGPDRCVGQPCPIHHPSPHHMVDWPLHWRADRGIMERLCPHRVGHPDPDDLRVRTGRDSGVHGCCLDRCCAEPPVCLCGHDRMNHTATLSGPRGRCWAIPDNHVECRCVGWRATREGHDG